MHCRYLFILSAFCVTCALASDDPLADLKKGQPKDIRELIDRLVGCNHWSNEEPYDAERKQEISSAIVDLKCARLAKDEAAARRRYADNPSALKALKQAQEKVY